MQQLLNEFSTLPNIGLVLAKNLCEIGLKSKDDLFELGSEKAFIRIRAIDQGACLHQLFAIEGALQGIRWHKLSKDKKEDLKVFFNQLID